MRNYECDCASSMHECFEHISNDGRMDVVEITDRHISARDRQGNLWFFTDPILLSSRTRYEPAGVIEQEIVPLTFEPFSLLEKKHG